MKKNVLFALAIVVIASMVLAACGGSAPKDMSLGTASGDYVAPMLQTVRVGGTVADGITLAVIAFIVALIASVVAFFAVKHFRDQNMVKGGGIAMPIFLSVMTFVVVVGLIFGPGYFRNSYVVIDQGSVGVQLNQGKAVGTLNPGPHFIIGYRDQVVIFTTREFTFSTNGDPHNHGSEHYRTWDMDVNTADGVDGDIPFQLRLKVNASNAMALYEEYGTLENAIVGVIKTPALEEARNVTRDKTAEQLMTNIDAYNSAVQALITAEADGFITVISFGFRQPDMGEWQAERSKAQTALQTAIYEENQEQVVQHQENQRVIKAQATADIAIINSQQAADSAVIAAEGQAEADKIAADAKAYVILTEAAAEAEANTLVSASLTPALIEYIKWGTKWNGDVPSTILNDETGVFITP